MCVEGTKYLTLRTSPPEETATTFKHQCRAHDENSCHQNTCHLPEIKL